MKTPWLSNLVSIKPWLNVPLDKSPIFFQRQGMGLCDPQHGSQQPRRSGGSGGRASAGRGADARQVR